MNKELKASQGLLTDPGGRGSLKSWKLPKGRKREYNHMATADVKESKMFRLRVGDKVSWNDTSEFPPVQYEGEVKGFDNDECTYLKVDLKNLSDEKAKTEEKVLTEDEVTRVG